MAKLLKLIPEHAELTACKGSPGCCCCCCCCCAHSLGGLIGAATARAGTPHPPTMTSEAQAGEPGPAAKSAPSAHLHYWLGLGLATALATVLSLLGNGMDGLLLVVLGLPAIQLITSVVLAIFYTRRAAEGDRERRSHLGRITLRGFVGACIGALIMLAMMFGW